MLLSCRLFPAVIGNFSACLHVWRHKAKPTFVIASTGSDNISPFQVHSRSKGFSLISIGRTAYLDRGALLPDPVQVFQQAVYPYVNVTDVDLCYITSGDKQPWLANKGIIHQ